MAAEAELRKTFGDDTVERAKQAAQQADRKERDQAKLRLESAALPSIKQALAPLIDVAKDVGRSRSVEEIAARLEKREERRAIEISAQKKRVRKARNDAAVEAKLLGAVATGGRPNVADSEHFGVRQVDDPHAKGTGSARRVLAATSLRDDPLGRLAKRKQIDEAQLQAGRRWQEDWEEAEIGGARAIDPGREYVDGGRIPEPWNEKQMAATQRLSRCAGWLGLEGAALVRDVLGQRMSLAQCAAARGLNPKTDCADMKYLGKRLRECLETLALKLGFAIKAAPGREPHDAAAVLGEVLGNPRLYDAVQRALAEA